MSRYISETVQDRDMITMERQKEYLCPQTISVISSDTDWP